MSALRRGGARLPERPSSRKVIKNLKARRNDCPVRPALGKYREGRMKHCGIVERAGIDRVRSGLADLAAKNQTHAVQAGIAHGFAAAPGPGAELPRLAGELHGPALNPHEGDEARAGRLAAIAAAAMALAGAARRRPHSVGRRRDSRRRTVLHFRSSSVPQRRSSPAPLACRVTLRQLSKFRQILISADRDFSKG